MAKKKTKKIGKKVTKIKKVVKKKKGGSHFK